MVKLERLIIQPSKRQVELEMEAEMVLGLGLVRHR
jgi:hypothetical protein